MQQSLRSHTPAQVLVTLLRINSFLIVFNAPVLDPECTGLLVELAKHTRTRKGKRGLNIVLY